MITINGAGGAQANPILQGLGIQLVSASSSMDIANVVDAFIDGATAFPGTTTVKSALTPVATVLTAGAAGTYNDTTKQWTISATAGLSAGDAIYLSHGSITDGIYRVATVVDGTDITITGNPLDGSGNQSNVAYQVAWSWANATSAAPIASSPAGTQNFFKFDADDGANNTQVEDSFWVADAPANADLIEIEGVDHSGQSVGDNILTLDLLRSWANNGGVAFAEMANHSVQTVNNFTWTSGGGTGEVSLATALAGLTAAAGDGAKYGRLILKAAAGSAHTVAIDIDVTVDTSGPSLTLSAFAI
ncbi:hypothetical protein N9J88_03320 [Porticoccaceae bacterium]|nr:hypothetical protein [Porticoccaceae bacterium]